MARLGVHHYGFLANCTRRRLLAQTCQVLAVAEPEAKSEDTHHAPSKVAFKKTREQVSGGVAFRILRNGAFEGKPA